MSTMWQQILEKLSSSYPWRNIFTFYDSIDSTNDRLKVLAKQGAPHGTVLTADQQTGGHGRLGRNFHSPAGTGIYMSILLRPQCSPTQLMHLTCAAAVAVCDAVEQSVGIRPGIKWINDLVYDGRKLCGILTELGLSPTGMVDYAIIGIGVNCCQEETDFPEEIRRMAGSLAMVSGEQIDRSLVAAAMMDSLAVMAENLISGKSAIMAKYRQDCITLGKEVVVVGSDFSRRGKALSIDEDGALIVEYDDGTVASVNSGEVSVRGLYGYA